MSARPSAIAAASAPTATAFCAATSECVLRDSAVERMSHWLPTVIDTLLSVSSAKHAAARGARARAGAGRLASSGGRAETIVLWYRSGPTNLT